MVWFSQHPALEKAVVAGRETFAATGLLVITGPSGVGKSHLARRIHQAVRGGASFVAQGAASLESARFESQLFGHERGSFSGAVQAYAGLLGGVGDGTLCLEGLEDLTPQNQAKMLRLLQSGAYRAVGALGERRFTGGLIFTSRFGLKDALAQNLLREDFYFRIQSAEIGLPELRERPDDFDDLFDALCAQVRKEMPNTSRVPDDADREWARTRPLVGNLHRLRNLIQQSVIRSVPLAELHTETPPAPTADLPDTGDLKGDLAVLEKRLLARAMQRYPGSRKELAEHLGISLRSLMYKLRDHELNG